MLGTPRRFNIWCGPRGPMPQPAVLSPPEASHPTWPGLPPTGPSPPGAPGAALPLPSQVTGPQTVATFSL